MRATLFDADDDLTSRYARAYLNIEICTMLQAPVCSGWRLQVFSINRETSS
jgi:hypothetical protein